MGAGTAGERGDSLSQLVVGMVAIGSADHVRGGPEHAVIDRYPKLQEHGCAGMPQDMRGNFRAQPCKIASCPPRPAFLGADRLSGPLNYVPGRKPAPATQVRH